MKMLTLGGSWLKDMPNYLYDLSNLSVNPTILQNYTFIITEVKTTKQNNKHR